MPTHTDPNASARPNAAGLRVRQASVRFETSAGPKIALDAVDLHVPTGRVVAVLGPSGCGKSTLLRAIAGIEPLAAGAIEFDGRDLRGTPTHRRGFAMMFQDGQLFAHQSVAANVAYALKLRGVDKAQRQRRVADLLDVVGLAGYERRKPATLSGGEQQRVALARALAADPRMLLLDEPLSALDRSLRERLADDLRGVLVGAGVTALLVTHDHDEAFTLADDLVVMRDGQVVQHGETGRVWRNPVDAPTALFLGYSAVLRPDQARVMGVDVPPGHGLAVRPTALSVDDAGSITGTVLRVGAAADRQRLQADVEGVGPIAAGADLAAQIAPGDTVRLTLRDSGVAVVPEGN